MTLAKRGEVETSNQHPIFCRTAVTEPVAQSYSSRATETANVSLVDPAVLCNKKRLWMVTAVCIRGRDRGTVGSVKGTRGASAGSLAWPA
jgi:hypothetical protein